MLILVSKNDCPSCAIVKKKAAAMGLEYLEFDAEELLEGHVPVVNDEILHAMAALMYYNMSVPILMNKGNFENLATYMLKGECEDGACTVGGK